MQLSRFVMPGGLLAIVASVNLLAVTATGASAAPASDRPSPAGHGTVAVKQLPTVKDTDRLLSGIPSDPQVQEVFGPYYLVNDHSSKCANVDGGSTADGAHVIQWPCGSSLSNDLWYFDHIGSGYYFLVNAYSGKCMNVTGGSTADGAHVVQWPCGSSLPNDIWALVALADGDYYWVNAYSGKCMNVTGGSTANGAHVVQWPCGSSLPNDEWWYF